MCSLLVQVRISITSSVINVLLTSAAFVYAAGRRDSASPPELYLGKLHTCGGRCRRLGIAGAPVGVWERLSPGVVPPGSPRAPGSANGCPFGARRQAGRQPSLLPPPPTSTHLSSPKWQSTRSSHTPTYGGGACSQQQRICSVRAHTDFNPHGVPGGKMRSVFPFYVLFDKITHLISSTINIW